HYDRCVSPKPPSPPMMQHRPTWRSWFLLAVFVAGGLGAPLLHQLDHAAARSRRQAAEAGRTAQVAALGADAGASGFVEPEVAPSHALVSRAGPSPPPATPPHPPARAASLPPRGLARPAPAPAVRARHVDLPIRAPPFAA